MDVVTIGGKGKGASEPESGPDYLPPVHDDLEDLPF